jgi:hypothetical protein
LAVPDDFGESKVGDFDFADAACADAGNEFAFVFFVFVFWGAGFGDSGGDKRDGFEEEVFRFYISAETVRGRSDRGDTDERRLFLRVDSGFLLLLGG